jgi:hypothetical protein
MKHIFAIIGSFLLAAIAIVLLGVGLEFIGFNVWAYFAPRRVAVENQVFHESQAYNDGMVRDLENLKMQYQQANDAQKLALKDVVLHRFAVYPLDRLPVGLRSFYENLRSGVEQ